MQVIYNIKPHFIRISLFLMVIFLLLLAAPTIVGAATADCESEYRTQANLVTYCETGYVSGANACGNLSDDQKTACEKGANLHDQNTHQTTNDWCENNTPQDSNPTTAERNNTACRKGYNWGKDGCKDYRGAEKTACEAGANGAEHPTNVGGPGAQQGNGNCPATDGTKADTGQGICATDVGVECGGVKTLLVKCSSSSASSQNAGYDNVVSMLGFFAKIAFSIIGLLCVIAIAAGGFMYASSSSDAGQKSQGINLIRNAVIGIVITALIVAGLEFLSPVKIFSFALPSLLFLWLE